MFLPEEHLTTTLDERASVLSWGREHLRPLPWRDTRDPWQILVCEVMAQQTGVQRVVPKWLEFLDRWPTPADLANADLADVLRVWTGLGYPRRARNLHLAAIQIVDLHDGVVPDDLEALLDLPGVGRYTARAVLAFAFEQPVGVVDTNVARVLARRSGRQLAAAEVQAVADALVPPADPWSWNQTIMEVGATCCRPTPRCGSCPLQATCAWFASGLAAPDPSAGSAGVSRAQARFKGSDREARGRLLAALLAGPVAAAALPAVAGLADDPDRALRLAADLVREGLASIDQHGGLSAPGSDPHAGSSGCAVGSEGVS